MITMPEGPFGNFEFSGPLDRTINEILVQGSMYREVEFEEQEEIIKNINEQGDIIKIARQESVIQFIPQDVSEYLDEDKTIFIFPIGDELDAEVQIDFIETMRDEGFNNIIIAVGDPHERMETMLDILRDL